MTNEEVICDVLEGDSWLWGFDVIICLFNDIHGASLNYHCRYLSDVK